jgi:serine/threonine-protein kinase RsbW
MKIVIQNQFSEISKVNDIIDDIVQPWKLSLRIASQLSLVLDELLSNIIRYGYKDKKNHDIEINLELKKNILYIEVTDDGIEFNPLLYPEPDLNPNLAEREIGGLGIHIMKKMTHEYFYTRKNGHNIQRLSKLLD